MHYAVIGCVHGNADALRAVLEDIRRRRIERTVCLGDVVGFGPEPLECLELVQQHCFVAIRGDHDEAMLSGTDGFIQRTAAGLDWTRELLQNGDPARTQRMLAFLQETRDSLVSAGIGFFHGSPRSRSEYLFPSDVTQNPRKLRAAFAATEKVSFFAHTHVPGVIIDTPLSWRSAQEIDGFFHYKKGLKALVNVGSVGQPRDGDPRACYLEIQKNQMYWRRVDYDVQSVVHKLSGIEPLSCMATRLQKGR